MAGRKIADPARVKDTIVTALSVGAYQQDACDAAGISVDTFDRWQKRDAEFAERVTRAKPQGWIADLAAIRSAAMKGDWRAAGEHLDRTGSPYRKAADTQISVTVNMQEIALKVAQDYGLDPAAVIAEAEAIMAGKS